MSAEAVEKETNGEAQLDPSPRQKLELMPDYHFGGLLPRSVLIAVGSTASWLCSLAVLFVLLWRRDAIMISFLIGGVASSFVGKLLKILIGQPRPDLNPPAERREGRQPLHYDGRVDKGMPSSHAVSMAFTFLYTAMSLPVLTVPLVLYGTIALTYRVKQKLHTWPQIAAGLTLGAINGFLWHTLTVGRNGSSSLVRAIQQTPWLINQEDGEAPFVILFLVAVPIGFTITKVRRNSLQLASKALDKSRNCLFYVKLKKN